MNAITETKVEHATIYAALAAAQTQMSGVKKDGKNDAFKRDGKPTSYATLASALEACLPALNKHGICVMQPTGEDETGRFVKTILAHTSGQTVECRVPLIVQKNDMQGYGSAVTYARRYGLMSMAGIAPEDEDDGNAAAKAAPKDEPKSAVKRHTVTEQASADAVEYLEGAVNLNDLKARWDNLPTPVKTLNSVKDAKEAAKQRLSQTATLADELSDEIPY